MSKPVLRGNTYWINVTIDGQRLRKSLGTQDEKLAKEAYTRELADFYRTRKFKEKPKKTLDQALDRWVVEKGSKKSFQDDKDKIAFFRKELGKKVKWLHEITAGMVEEILPQDVKPATRNRYRALIRGVLNRAKNVWEWLDDAPKFIEENEPARRVAFLTHQQAADLLALLPEKYRTPVRLALLTGLRRSNVFNLTWENVNLELNTLIIHADEHKGDERQVVPLNAQAWQLLATMPGERLGRVFKDVGDRISPSVWKRVTAQIGAPWCRFHDLRHTWATWHAMAGTPTTVLQELGGWATTEMVRKYAHIPGDHLAAAAERVVLPDTNLAQPANDAAGPDFKGAVSA
jgi:integrase